MAKASFFMFAFLTLMQNGEFMKTKTTIVLAFLLVTFLISWVAIGLADTIATGASYTNYNATSSDPQTATSGSIISTAQTGTIPIDPSSNYGWQAVGTANVTGHLAASAEYSAGGNPNDVKASASLTQSVTNNTGQNLTYQLTFNISGGTLALFDYAGYSWPEQAQLQVTISENNNTLWQTGAILTGGYKGDTPDLTLSGTTIPHVSISSSNPSSMGGYNFGPYSETLNFIVLAGQTVSLSYLMDVEVSGPGYEQGALAQLGDPLQLTGGISLSAPKVVPVPAGAPCLGHLERRAPSKTA
jgi:hypothetical protein